MNVLLLVVLKTDQPDIKRRLDTILAAAHPTGHHDSQPCVWAKSLSELTVVDLDRLAAIIGPEAVVRLNVGDPTP